MFAMFMGLKSISCQELHHRMQNGGVIVIDVNAPQSWLSAHVPGALNLSVDFDPAALPNKRDVPLVFYCSNPFCRKAPQAAKHAIKLGYSDVSVMSAGITGWNSAGLPFEAGT
ncbi:rhodanese-like domain-containing protein (plasmid) [Deinococcus taeanensis]|uniref:rhodanese-like domain-containing protein n=1 Tax=Deinococcus taeanensis TaxID=2737050 RepID=UPI001CDB64AD|nr:rhodanese-like domain-containing protein [Deinococcus taeanensis]UBV44506.1 rhodanese-like domain-containing protein [Deinococcus taeanensis]